MNKDLQTARSNKADEFYTTYTDIEKEMNYYSDYFIGKVVYCPCDDYRFSNFYKFFKDNFHNLSLKKLIATSYIESGFGNQAVYDGVIEYFSIMENDGDFASEYCRNLMKSSDIVVTNPPFSKFRAFVNQIMDYKVDFVILGNINAVSYKEVFKYIVQRRIMLGPSIHSGDRSFRVPDDYPLDGTACYIENGIKYIRVKGVRWFTTVKTIHSVKNTVLTECYEDSKYQKFDTYDAINVNTMKEIPYNYDGEMGVPITVLDKMNHRGFIQFEKTNGDLLEYKLIGQLNSGNGQNYDFAKPVVDGKCKFKRLVIKKV